MLQNSGPFIPLQRSVVTKNVVAKVFMMSFLPANKIWDQLTVVSNKVFWKLPIAIF